MKKLILIILFIFGSTSLEAEGNIIFEKNTIISDVGTMQGNYYDIGNEETHYIDQDENGIFAHSFKNLSGYLNNDNTVEFFISMKQAQSVEMIAESSHTEGWNLDSITYQNEDDNMMDSIYYKDYYVNKETSFQVHNEFVAPKDGVYKFSITLIDSNEQSSFAFRIYNHGNTFNSPSQPYQYVFSKHLPTYNNGPTMSDEAGSLDWNLMDIEYNYTIEDFQGGSIGFSTSEISGSGIQPGSFTIESNQVGVAKGKSFEECTIPLEPSYKSNTVKKDYIDGTCSIQSSNSLVETMEFSNIFPTGDKSTPQPPDELPEYFDFNGDGIIDQNSEFINVKKNDNMREIQIISFSEVKSNDTLKRDEFLIEFNVPQPASYYEFNFEIKDQMNNELFTYDKKVNFSALNVNSVDPENPYDDIFSYTFKLPKAVPPNSKVILEINSSGYSENHIVLTDMNSTGEDGIKFFNYEEANDIQYYNDSYISHRNGIDPEYIYFDGTSGLSSTSITRKWASEENGFGNGTAIDTWTKDDFSSGIAKIELETSHGNVYKVNTELDDNTISDDLEFNITVDEISGTTEQESEIVTLFDKKIIDFNPNYFDTSKLKIEIGANNTATLLNELSIENLIDNGIQYNVEPGQKIELQLTIPISKNSEIGNVSVENTAFIQINNQISDELCLDSDDIDLSDDDNCYSSFQENIIIEEPENNLSIINNIKYVNGENYTLDQYIAPGDKIIYEIVIQNNSFKDMENVNINVDFEKEDESFDVNLDKIYWTSANNEIIPGDDDISNGISDITIYGHDTLVGEYEYTVPSVSENSYNNVVTNYIEVTTYKKEESCDDTGCEEISSEFFYKNPKLSMELSILNSNKIYYPHEEIIYELKLENHSLYNEETILLKNQLDEKLYSAVLYDSMPELEGIQVFYNIEGQENFSETMDYNELISDGVEIKIPPKSVIVAEFQYELGSFIDDGSKNIINSFEMIPYNGFCEEDNCSKQVNIKYFDKLLSEIEDNNLINTGITSFYIIISMIIIFLITLIIKNYIYGSEN